MIEDNKAQRMAAVEIFELVLETAQSFDDPSRFWEELRKRVGFGDEEEPRKLKDKMTDDESRKFGRKPMPFGEYLGREIDHVPVERLEWYADQTFMRELRRYLRSNRIKSEGVS